MRSRAPKYGLTASLSSPSAFFAAASRRLARSLPFRAHRLSLDAPMVSFTFDDCPADAARNAAPILEAADMRGTFYLSTAPHRLDGHELVDAPGAARLAARGHDLGAHTHAHLNVQATPTRALLDDVARNDEAIAALSGGRAPSSFAYPYGVVSLRTKRRLSRRYRALRGIQPGVNAGLIDPAHLKACEIYDRTTSPDAIARLLDETERKAGWLILYTHDVSDAPGPYGCSPALFRRVVEAVRERGLSAVTVDEGLGRAGL